MFISPMTVNRSVVASMPNVPVYAKGWISICATCGDLWRMGMGDDGRFSRDSFFTWLGSQLPTVRELMYGDPKPLHEWWEEARELIDEHILEEEELGGL